MKRVRTWSTGTRLTSVQSWIIWDMESWCSTEASQKKVWQECSHVWSCKCVWWLFCFFFSPFFPPHPPSGFSLKTVFCGVCLILFVNCFCCLGVLEEAEFYNITSLIKLVKDKIRERDCKTSQVSKVRVLYSGHFCCEEQLPLQSGQLLWFSCHYGFQSCYGFSWICYGFM